MSEDAKTSWYCIGESTIPKIVAESDIIARSWLNAHVATWERAGQMATRKSGVEIEGGELEQQLVHSGSPLSEFAEACYKVKKDVYNPDLEWTQTPPAKGYAIMASFACLIYQLNKCAATYSSDNMKSAYQKYEVCKSYVGSAPLYTLAFESLPTKTLLRKVKQQNDEALSRSQNEQNSEPNKDKVEKMKSLGDLKIVLITLATAAKTRETTASLTQHTHTLERALDAYEWNKLDVCKKITHVLELYTVRMISI